MKRGAMKHDSPFSPYYINNSLTKRLTHILFHFPEVYLQAGCALFYFQECQVLFQQQERTSMLQFVFSCLHHLFSDSESILEIQEQLKMQIKENFIITGGKIFTSDRKHPYADSMIIEKGKIKWIGKKEELPACGYPVKDLKGKRVLPGFTDAHMHPVMLADMNRQISCLPPNVHSIRELIEKIQSVRKTQEADQWILGWGYDEGKLAEHRSPDRYDLDKGCADAPVCIVRTCLHIRCVNSKALELAGINKDTPDPPGGKIDRDENGEPTGILRESARDFITRVMPEKTEEDTIGDLLELGKLLASQGITAVGDMGNLEPGDHLGEYRKAASMGFAQKVGLYYMWEHFAEEEDFHFSPEALRKDGQIRIAGLKLIGDGSISGRTAWVKEPYPQTGEYGISVCPDELLESAISFCKKQGCQLSVHAMGEAAIDWIIQRVGREETWTEGNTAYLRIEHAAEPGRRAIKQAAEKGFGIAVQPIFLYSEIESYIKNLGIERTCKTYPIRTMLDKGVKLCLSTDAPATAWAEPSNPFVCIKGAVTRKAYDGTDCGQQERIDIETAVQLYTKESAEIAGFEHTGQLKPGYDADFIVLDQDILALPPEQIDHISVEETYINGKQVYCKKER